MWIYIIFNTYHILSVKANWIIQCFIFISKYISYLLCSCDPIHHVRQVMSSFLPFFSFHPKVLDRYFVLLIHPFYSKRILIFSLVTNLIALWCFNLDFLFILAISPYLGFPLWTQISCLILEFSACSLMCSLSQELLFYLDY